MKLKEIYALFSNYDQFIFYNFKKKEIKLAFQLNCVIYLDYTNTLTKHNKYEEKLPKILMEIEC